MSATRVFFAAFSDELVKLSAAVPKPAGWKGVGGVGVHIPSLIAGGALLYGGNRMLKDYKLGRQVRKEQGAMPQPQGEY